MSNHSQEFDPVMHQHFMEKFGEKFGPTGDFPEGKLTKLDEGEIKFGITVKDGKVIIDFGGPVYWLGMTPKQAHDLGQLLIKRSREARGEQ